MIVAIMSARPPVVAILGHVDHGKTSLLDYIRQSRIAAKEHGGITQRIGAYEITVPVTDYPTNKITFIDTPGHEAFSQLRARGATIADVAILIIDGKDSLMPQTVESIFHIKSAKIPFIVAINKVDLPDANPEKVKKDLLKHEVQVEGMGGTVPVVEISAKTGKGIPDLLESILLLSTDQNLTYEPTNPVLAPIVETKKDKRGTVVSAIVKDGTLKVGEFIFAEDKKAKIRTLINDLGQQVREATPSMPVEILGFEELPEVGAVITAEEAAGRQKAEVQKQAFDINALLRGPAPEEKLLSVIIKTDSQGSLEAIEAALVKNTNIKVVLTGVGDITRSDVFLAKTTKAIVVGFSVIAPKEVLELARTEKVVVKSYNLIYELLEELEEVSDLLQEKEQQEKSLKGEAKIQATFTIEGEKIYGVKVTKGKFNLGDSVEIYRDANMLLRSKLVSLRHRAKVIQEAKKDSEAGMVLSPALDFRVGDVVKSIL